MHHAKRYMLIDDEGEREIDLAEFLREHKRAPKKEIRALEIGEVAAEWKRGTTRPIWLVRCDPAGEIAGAISREVRGMPIYVCRFCVDETTATGSQRFARCRRVTIDEMPDTECDECAAPMPVNRLSPERRAVWLAVHDFVLARARAAAADMDTRAYDRALEDVDAHADALDEAWAAFRAKQKKGGI